VLVGAAILSNLTPFYDSDPFWHLGLGRAVVDEGSRSIVEPWSFVGETSTRVVPEWGWDVLVVLLNQLGGWWAQQGLVLSAAIASVLLTWGWLAQDRQRSVSGLVVVTTLVLSVVAVRIRLRPQTAFMVLVPATLWLSQVCAEANGRRRIKTVVGLVALEVVWAQLHGSFVLAPALVALGILRIRPIDRRDLPLALGLAIGMMTSAYGLDLIPYLLSHAGSDAAAHVTDMRRPELSLFFNPRSRYGPAYLMLWGLAAVGIIRQRKIPYIDLALALLGLCLAMVAMRFIAAACLLVAPLALRGASNLLEDRWPSMPIVVSIFSLGVLGRMLLITHQVAGPIGVIGPAPGQHPKAAAAWLAQEPAGRRVFGTYSTGAALGFWLPGHVRTYIDARTPLHFGDADYGVARDAWRDATVLRRVLDHYQADTAVVRRSEPVCEFLAASWKPVVVGPSYTTFVPLTDSTPGLTALAPCGTDPLRTNACELGTLSPELERLEPWVPPAWFDHLAGERIVRCGGDLSKVVIPPASLSRSFSQAQESFLAKLALAEGHSEQALDLLRDRIEQGDMSALAILGPVLFDGTIALPSSRNLLEEFVRSRDDSTPPRVRGDLAWLCMKLDDPECARTQSFRAAAQGGQQLDEVLHWLSIHHSESDVRAEAAAWLESNR
jgi:hypothetical protein